VKQGSNPDTLTVSELSVLIASYHLSHTLTHTHTHVLLTDGASVIRLGLFWFRFGGFTGWSGQAFCTVGSV